jgi:hypothetical protein
MSSTMLLVVLYASSHNFPIFYSALDAIVILTDSVIL